MYLFFPWTESLQDNCSELMRWQCSSFASCEPNYFVIEFYAQGDNNIFNKKLKVLQKKSYHDCKQIKVNTNIYSRYVLICMILR